jgi:hypothetical protein
MQLHKRTSLQIRDAKWRSPIGTKFDKIKTDHNQDGIDTINVSDETQGSSRVNLAVVSVVLKSQNASSAGQEPTVRSAGLKAIHRKPAIGRLVLRDPQPPGGLGPAVNRYAESVGSRLGDRPDTASVLKLARPRLACRTKRR